MRLFVAVDVPETLQHAVERDVASELRPHLPGARWTRVEGRHLTLKFLGEVADERVADVSAAVSHAVASHRPFTAVFDRVGGFPNLGRPRVLWVGVREGEGAERMGAIAGEIDAALEPLGFEAEKRAFHPHLTLARFKTPQRVGELPEVTVPREPFEVSEVLLFRSQLHPKGARYTVIERFVLGG